MPRAHAGQVGPARNRQAQRPREPGLRAPREPDLRAPREPERRWLRWLCAWLPALVTALLGCVYILAEGGQETGRGFPLDDSWIHLQFARNLAAGQGFSFNPGEPIAGSTAPLWTFLLAGIHGLARQPEAMVIAAKLLGIMLTCLSVLLAQAYLLRRTRDNRVACLGALALGLTSHLSWGAVSGLEVPLYTTLSLAVLLYGEELETFARRLLVAALLALAVWARPECLLLAALLLLDRALFARGRRAWLALGQLAGLYVLFLVPYFVMNHALSGGLFPHTFAVKVADRGLLTALGAGDLERVGRLLVSSGPGYFAGFVRHLFRANPLLPLGALAGLIFWTARFARAREERSLFLPGAVLTYSFAIGVVAPFLGADFQSGRYVANQTAFAVVLAALGMHWLHLWLRARTKRAATAVIAAALALGGFNMAVAQGWMVRTHTSAVASVNQIDVYVGRWLAAHTPPDAMVATNDIGAIGYFSGRRVLDLMGLVSPAAAEWIRREGSTDGGAMAFVQETRPDYIAFFPRWLPGLARALSGDLLLRRDLRENTACEWTCVPRTETLLGVVLLKVAVPPSPAMMVVLKPRYPAPGSAGE